VKTLASPREASPNPYSRLTAIVDKTVANGVQSLPSQPLFGKRLQSYSSHDRNEVVDEKEVACFYERTTATFCLGLASSLALGVPSSAQVEQSANVSGYAIADGFLYFSDPTDLADQYAQLEVGMGKETVKQIRLMAEKRSSLATHEFKNWPLVARKYMLAVPNLSNMPIFEWTDCNAPDCATLTRHEEQRTYVRERSRIWGPMPKTPYGLSTIQITHLQSSSGKRKRDDDSNDDKTRQSSLST
jgi:hypothetical protein